MDPEISGLENIIIRGLFLGMTRKQMEERVDDIAEFTELGDFLRMPLRTYSTGMRVRLALGVVTSIDPEILLLDEGIGAVDAAFLEKSKKRLSDLVDRPGCWSSPRTPTSSCAISATPRSGWSTAGSASTATLEDVLAGLQGHPGRERCRRRGAAGHGRRGHRDAAPPGTAGPEPGRDRRPEPAGPTTSSSSTTARTTRRERRSRGQRAAG